MTAYRTIEIDEVETEVCIEFENQFGDIEITKMTDVESGDAIAPDLMTPRHYGWLLEDLMETEADIKAEKGRFYNEN